MLDVDVCYQALGIADEDRRNNYLDFVGQGIPQAEQLFLREAYRRNQLSGDSTFIDEIEQRIGIRVEQRGRGRPAREKK
jgi:putative transposase